MSGGRVTEFLFAEHSVSHGVPVAVSLTHISDWAAIMHADEAEIDLVIAQVRSDVRRAYFGLLAADTRASLMQAIRNIAVRARDACVACCDFRPDDVLFLDGRAVLADFGISLLKSDEHTHTRLTPTPAHAISAMESTAA